MGWDNDTLGYTDRDNPFGDEHFTSTFVWTKKHERDGDHKAVIESGGEAALEEMQRRRREETRLELEKVKRRREEREKEQEERERERESEQRSKETAFYKVWEAQEDAFHLQQAKLRSAIRIADARAKPIDLLAAYVSAEDDEDAVEMHEPYSYLRGLSSDDLEDLLVDIRLYQQLEQGKNADFWRDMTAVVQFELSRLRQAEAPSAAASATVLNSAVQREIAAMFEGKSLGQLQLLEQQVVTKLALSGDSKQAIDVGYWEALLQQLRAHVARSRLLERHQQVLKRKLERLKREQGIALSASEAAASHAERTLFPISLTSEQSAAAARPAETKQETEDETEKEEREREAKPEEENEEDAVESYDSGRLSPKLVAEGELPVEVAAAVCDPDDDVRRLAVAREQVLRTGQVQRDSELDFESRARASMEAAAGGFAVGSFLEGGAADGSAPFGGEVSLGDQTFLWADKYRPRKPRFFNRVHTGFEWNKYNQTHYDMDNPPPKIVQGYKFNIFYPDLIDKSKPPRYTLTPLEGDERDFAVLRFEAGAPYEDIAFKVANREWDVDHIHGFRCQYLNGIFQLWFRFRRYRYRK